MPDPSRARLARIRPVADRLLPLGTRRRDTAAAAVGLVKLGRRVANDSAQLAAEFGELAAAGSQVVRATGLPWPAEPYPLWLARHRVDGAGRRAQQDVHEQATDPIRLLVVIVSGGDPRPVAATRRSLQRQSWPSVRTVVVGAEGGQLPWAAAARAAGLGDEAEGRDFVIFLRAGDILEPDAAFHVAETAWRDPAIDLVYWDDDLVGTGGLPSSPGSVLDGRPR